MMKISKFKDKFVGLVASFTVFMAILAYLAMIIVCGAYIFAFWDK